MLLRLFVAIFAALRFCGVGGARPLLVWEQNVLPPRGLLSENQFVTSMANISSIFLNKNLSLANKLQIERVARNSIIPGNKYLMLLYFNNRNCRLGMFRDSAGMISMSQTSDSYTTKETSVFVHAVMEQNCIYIGATKQSSIMPKVAQLSLLKIHDFSRKSKPDFYEVQQLTITSKLFLKRDYLYTFHGIGYTYFLVKDTFINPSKKDIKIFRKRQENNRKSFLDYQNYELELQSIATSHDIREVVYLKLNESLIVGLVESNHITFLSYSIFELDKGLDAVEKQCSQGNYDFYPQWSQEKVSCSNLNMVGQVNTIVANTALSANSHLVVNASSISAVVLDLVNHTHFSTYVATTTSKKWIEQLSISTNLKEVTLVESIEVPHAVFYIQLTHHLLFAATKHQILAYQVDHSQGYKACASCERDSVGHCYCCTKANKYILVAQRNKLILPYICENQINCFSLPGLFHTTFNQSLAVDNLYSVKLVTGVTVSEESRIICSADKINFTVKGYTNGSSIYCNFNTKCVSELMFRQSELLVRLEILITMGNSSAVLPGGTVRFYNCSLLTSCSTCVSVRGCGWHVCQGQCESASSTSLSLRDHVKDSKYHVMQKKEKKMILYSSCPVLLPSSRGRYVFPVGIPVNVSLITKNILPPILKCGYKCKLHFSRGETLSVPGFFNSSTQVLCHIKPHQVVISRNGSGVEHLGISLWMKNTEGREYQLEHQLSAEADRLKRSIVKPYSLPFLSRYPRLAAVDCSLFSDSCSLCTAANKQAENTCVWCVSVNTCTALTQCTSTFINSSTRCYSNPIIRSITPQSGPTVGGTVVTITGSDLGVDHTDIDIKIGGVNCSVKHFSYLTAKQVSCITGSSSLTGPVPINVTVSRRTFFRATFASGVSNVFFYAHPIVTEVWPTYGPFSGGTILRLTGSALNISNTIQTAVTAANINCRIQEISYHVILCELAASGTVVTGSVRLSIDHASIAAPQSFSFRKNPEFLQLVPQYTIPSGGVKLKFYGNYLNVSIQPTLVIFVEHEPYTAICRVVSSHLLLCPSPKLESLLDHRSAMSQLQRSEGNSSVLLNYTVQVDGAPGPNIHNQSLSLNLRNNPVLLKMAPGATYSVSSNNLISITGNYITSVSMDEIKVTLLGENCSIIMVSSTVIQCRPPDFPIRANRSIDVTVTIGNGTLVYNVGSVLYVLKPAVILTPSEEPFPSTLWVMVIAVSFVGVCIIVLLIGLILAICSVAARRRNRIFRVTHQDIPPNPRIDSCLQKSTNSVNWYEVVSDPLAEGDSRFNSQRNLVGHLRQPSQSTTSRILSMANDRESRASQRLMTASPNHRSVPSVYNESRSCSVGRQSYTGLLHGDHINMNPNEEYVRMSSHLVASNLSISTSAYDRHPKAEEENEEEEDEEEEEGCDALSIAEYVDMQTPEQGSKYSISSDSPPITFHKNLETVV